MDCPDYVLENGTSIRTHSDLPPTTGFLIKAQHLEARKPEKSGIIAGIVGGHGGDVYWVKHEGDEYLAAYGWWEFKLESQ